MPVADITGFSVGGKINGVITIPCNGTDSVDVVLSMRIRLRRGENAALIPIWIGERRVFGWTTLIEDIFIASPQPGVWTNMTRTYNVVCVKGCKLKASGPGGGRYFQDGRELELTAARYNPDYFLPGSKWWYVNNSVTVRCAGRTKSVAYEPMVDGYGSGNQADDELLAMANNYREGDVLRITPSGRITHRRLAEEPPQKTRKPRK